MFIRILIAVMVYMLLDHHMNFTEDTIMYIYSAGATALGLDLLLDK